MFMYEKFFNCKSLKGLNLFNFKINPLASPNEVAPALKYEDVNRETPSIGEVKGLILIVE